MTIDEIQEIREFNRFYTSIIGLLNNHILESPYSLPEARVIYELFNRQHCTATEIIEITKIDKGYLSRILLSFKKSGLLAKKKSKKDSRATLLTLTAKGESEFTKINTASIEQVRALFSKLSSTEIQEVIHHMKELKRILSR
jgi:DNA-binding MarR family transcriptional regulator